MEAILSDATFLNALRRIFRPIVRTMIARGMRYPDVLDLLKDLYVDVAVSDFDLGDKRVTDSRISLLTGLQRKDIRAIKERTEDADEIADRDAGPLPRVLALWRGDPRFRDADGTLAVLPQSADVDPSFDGLVAEVSRDMHPRTVLDELERLGMVIHDRTAKTVTLTAAAFVPSADDAALVDYFGANLGDHAAAAAENLAAAPEPGPFFERAVHYNRLSPNSLDALEALARKRQSDVLAELNAEALALQRKDKKKRSTGRFRLGAFFYRAPGADAENQEDDA